jgi:hypothetical protein
MRELALADFDPKEKFWTRFPPEGSKVTPPHSSPDFRWKDYCPMVFRCLFLPSFNTMYSDLVSSITVLLTDVYSADI